MELSLDLDRTEKKEFILFKVGKYLQELVMVRGVYKS